MELRTGNELVVIEKYHDISAGHRVVGHENKCRGLHGHNYRITFTLKAKDDQLDNLGRVIDFGVISNRLCQWLEDKWDHRLLLWQEDPVVRVLRDYNFAGNTPLDSDEIRQAFRSLLVVPFNPTAENMALYLRNVVGGNLVDTNAVLIQVKVEETRKASATVFDMR
jgi:6-pyruvoyltetrahydropterin/6-carboxytetrahydropterin synthase